MTNLKPEVAKKAKNIKGLLSEVEESLKYYKAFDDPHYGHIGDLAKTEASLKEILNND